MKWVKSKVRVNGKIYKGEYPEPKKHIEFSKIAVIIITAFCMCCIAFNYVLAFLEKTNVNEAVTIALITTILGTVIGYFIKAGKENLIKIKKSKEESEEN